MAKRIVVVPVELPVEVFDDLEREAGPGLRRAGAFIRRQVQARRTGVAKSVRANGPKTSPLEKWFGVFKGGDPHGSNNEKIDADIAREIAGEGRNGKRR